MNCKIAQACSQYSRKTSECGGLSLTEQKVVGQQWYGFGLFGFGLRNCGGVKAVLVSITKRVDKFETTKIEFGETCVCLSSAESFILIFLDKID